MTDHSEIRLACIVELRAKHGLNFTVKLGNVSKIKTFYIKLATSSRNRRELARSPSDRSASYFSTRFIKFYIKNFLCPVSGGPKYFMKRNRKIVFYGVASKPTFVDGPMAERPETGASNGCPHRELESI